MEIKFQKIKLIVIIKILNYRYNSQLVLKSLSLYIKFMCSLLIIIELTE